DLPGTGSCQLEACPVGIGDLMAWNRRSFPAVFVRLAALACATALALSVAPSVPAGAISKRQVDAAKADVKRLQAKIAEARTSLLSLQQQVSGVTEELLSAQDLYDQVAAQLLATRQKVSETQASLDVVQSRLNARAADVFVNGTSTNLDFILGATSLADLS